MEFELIRSDRTTCQIQIKNDGRIVVRAPRRMIEKDIYALLENKREWIDRTLAKIEKAKEEVRQFSESEIENFVIKAKAYIPKRVETYARIMGVEYGCITIRNQKTRWGSCSGKGNLNFNCMLMAMPLEVVDYVIVHELCHLKEMNHSERFWDEVVRVMPDYKRYREYLRKNGRIIIGEQEK